MNVQRTIQSNLEEQRRRVLLKPFLTAAFILSFVAVAIVIGALIQNGRSLSEYFFAQGGIYTIGLIPAVLGSLLLAAYRGYLKISAVITVSILALFSLFTIAEYGIVTAQGVVSMLLAILIAGATLSISTTVLYTTGLSLSYAVVFFLHKSNIVPLTQIWSNADSTIGDVIITILSFGVVLFTVIVFQRETNNALERAIALQEELRAERDSLEIVVTKRTEALKESQYARVLELSRFADLGRHSAALMHDLINHLNALRINLDAAQSDTDNTKSSDAQQALTRANHAASLMEHFVQSIRRDMQAQTSISTFDAKQEIHDVLDSLSYRARMYQVELIDTDTESITLTTDQVKFYRIIQNLLANAIDSYEGIADARKRTVTICLKVKDEIIITVTDHGCGMNEEQVGRVFEPFYTTKGITNGTGIGMTIVQELVTQSLQGQITVESKERKGTTITVTLPASLIAHDGE